MIFSEYATGLAPFLSFGKSEYDFFTELIWSMSVWMAK